MLSIVGLQGILEYRVRKFWAWIAPKLISETRVDLSKFSIVPDSGVWCHHCREKIVMLRPYGKHYGPGSFWMCRCGHLAKSPDNRIGSPGTTFREGIAGKPRGADAIAYELYRGAE